MLWWLPYLLLLITLLTKCQQEIRDGESGNPIEECVKEEDSVYYRFCGAALSSMLHSRYEKRVDCIKPDKKDCIQREIVVLRAKVISQVSWSTSLVQNIFHFLRELDMLLCPTIFPLLTQTRCPARVLKCRPCSYVPLDFLCPHRPDVPADVF